jgi:hypothetical protein
MSCYKNPRTTTKISNTAFQKNVKAEICRKRYHKIEIPHMMIHSEKTCYHPFQNLCCRFSRVRIWCPVLRKNITWGWQRTGHWGDYLGLMGMKEPTLWSTGQSFWLQIQRFQVRFPALPDFLRSSGPGASPLSISSIIEELLGRNISCSGLEISKYDHGDPLSWPHDTLYPQMLVLTSPTSGRYSLLAD